MITSTKHLTNLSHYKRIVDRKTVHIVHSMTFDGICEKFLVNIGSNKKRAFAQNVP